MQLKEIVAIGIVITVVSGQHFDLTGQEMGKLGIGMSSLRNVASILRTNRKLDTLKIKNYKSSFMNGSILSSSNYSGKCVNSLKKLVHDLQQMKPYALKMLDSWGKPQSGLLTGNIQWLGRYFECQKVRTDEFYGKWCSLSAGKLEKAFGSVSSLVFKLGTCVPDTCTDEDVGYLFKPISSSINISQVVNCPDQFILYTAADITSIVIFGILLILMMCGTLYEVYRNNYCDSEYREVLLDNNTITSLDDQNASVLKNILLSFSVIKNTKLIFDTSQKDGNINLLHGLRFISMTWVILGHTNVMSSSTLDNPLDFANYILKSGTMQAISNATISVDTFFFLSGLLAAYLGLRELRRRQGKYNVLFIYLYRYLRLTPAYALTILFTSSLYSKIADGPYWREYVDDISKSCSKYWWTNLLYINNIYPSTITEECFSISWYLANDTQFFLLSPFIISLLFTKPMLGLISLLVGSLSSIILTFGLSMHYHEQPEPVGRAILYQSILGDVDSTYGNSTNLDPIGPHLSLADKIGSDLYTKPWCRISPYLIGMATGYLLHSTRCRLRMKKIYSLIIWCAAIATALLVLYGLWPSIRNANPLSDVAAAFYLSLSRPVWTMCVVWVVVASESGNGGFINKFLSWKAFIPLSRLTYCAYLVHPFVLHWGYASQEVGMHFSVNGIALHFLGFATLSYGVAFLLSLTIEMPVISMMKLFLRGGDQRKFPNSETDAIDVFSAATEQQNGPSSIVS